MPKILTNNEATAKLLARSSKPAAKPAATPKTKPVAPGRKRALRVNRRGQLGLPAPGSETPVNDSTPESIIASAPETVALTESVAVESTESDATETRSERELARAAARAACAEFYAGASVPFKFRGDLKRLSPLNFAYLTDPTARSAAACALLLAYCDIDTTSLTFERGSASMPGRLLGKTGAESRVIYRTGIESGCLSQLIGTGAVTYISGPQHGTGAESALFRINPERVRANLQPFNSAKAGASGGRVFTSSFRVLRALETKNQKAGASKPVTPASAMLPSAPEAEPATPVDYDESGNSVNYA